MYWSHFLYYISVATLKLAFLIFYSELFSRRQSKCAISLYIVSGMWFLTYLAAFLLLFLYCLPLTENWYLFLLPLLIL